MKRKRASLTEKELPSLFVPPGKTPARTGFGGVPDPPSFEEARVVVYGVPFDDTATFGKGTSRGPRGIRHTSAHQIETFLVDKGFDLYEKVPILDLGDLRIPRRLDDTERTLLLNEHAPGTSRAKVIRKLDSILKQFEVLADLTRFLRSAGKIPLLLGGEHTLSYWTLAAVAPERPVVIHFDAHRDAKSGYLGMRLNHTTPMYHFLTEHGRGVDFVQIGIRQTDREENEFAEKAGVKTFFPRDVRHRLPQVRKWIRARTRGRAVYVTFDIDALDIAYTPCTGTPEPFGLTPEEAVALFDAIHPSARLVGADMMEVAVRRKDYREATTATQLLLRLLSHPCFR